VQKDVFRVVQLFESRAGCETSKVTNTVVVDPLSQGKWSERWTVDRCGTQGSYLIDFMKGKTGGTDFAVHKEN
jgi:hypothetical protein